MTLAIIAESEKVICRDVEILSQFENGSSARFLFSVFPITYRRIAQTQFLGKQILTDILVKSQFFKPFAKNLSVEFFHINILTIIRDKILDY